MGPVYQLGILLYGAAIHVAALWKPKAASWVGGRRGLLQHIESVCNPKQQRIWIHCPSLGEFEQGRPIIEQLHEKYPNVEIVLTFYSPSGYEIQKNYKGVDHVFYLPLDTPWNAKRFVRAINPALAIFVKYDFWLNYLRALHQHDSTTILASGIFRPDQHFFGRFPQLGRQMLRGFDHFFVQDAQSLKLLNRAGYENITLSGDTRFDRVQTLAQRVEPVEKVALFSKDSFTAVAGSTWPGDEAVLLPVVNEPTQPVKWVIAPHEISEQHLSQIEDQLSVPSVRYSQASEKELANSKVLIIDNIGLLSRIYQYGKFAYVGGGFGKSIHNILEAATWGAPVIFGPRHEKFKEAHDLLQLGGAIEVHNEEDLKRIVDQWRNEPEKLNAAGSVANNYVRKNAGASEIVFDWIQSQLSF